MNRYFIVFTLATVGLAVYLGYRLPNYGEIANAEKRIDSDLVIGKISVSHGLIIESNRAFDKLVGESSVGKTIETYLPMDIATRHAKLRANRDVEYKTRGMLISGTIVDTKGEDIKVFVLLRQSVWHNMAYANVIRQDKVKLIGDWETTLAKTKSL